MIPNAKTLRQGEVSLRRKSTRMEASLLPRKNYASAISDRLNVDPIRDALSFAVLHRGTQAAEIRCYEVK